MMFLGGLFVGFGKMATMSKILECYRRKEVSIIENKASLHLINS